ncbi:MAG: hypothetical protein J6Y07_03855 [Alphaproteobacteria bacterium]|nr:hypothetical protein [Alphaproteobacteria bacterium]
MKKRTALTLSLMALLAGGITFGALKYKDKKEKDEVERELKEILIPNAENRLDSLLVVSKGLQDSIAHYEQEINKIDNDSLISRIDVEVIDKLLSNIGQDWRSAVSKWDDKYFDLYYEGDGSFNEDGLPQNAKNQILYLNGGILKGFDGDTTWTIPGYTMEHRVIYGELDRPPIAGYFPVELGRPGYREYMINDISDGYDTYFEQVLGSLRESVSQVLPFQEDDDTFVNDPREQLDPIEQEQLLRTLKCFVEKIDNSQNVINPATLRKLGTIVDSLLIKADMKNLSQKRSNAYNKYNTFRNADYKVRQQLSKQRQLLERYQSPNAVKTVMQQRTAHK